MIKYTVHVWYVFKYLKKCKDPGGTHPYSNKRPYSNEWLKVVQQAMSKSHDNDTFDGGRIGRRRRCTRKLIIYASDTEAIDVE